MKAAIIAAGEGSRLKSEGITTSKPLVLLDGIPLIERLVRTFVRCGVTEVACIVNEYSHEVKKFIETTDFGVPVRLVVRTTPSSMHSLFALAPYLKGGSFLLSTVDTVFDEEEFARYVRYGFESTSSDGVLAVTDFVDDENPLYVTLDGSKRILGFSKTEAAPWVTGGLYILSDRIFSEMERVRAKGIERLRNFLGYLVAHDYRLEGYAFSKMVDIDHASDIRAAEHFLRGN